jgi:putative component of toxin-antitoxin plasmid stabilization module
MKRNHTNYIQRFYKSATLNRGADRQVVSHPVAGDSQAVRSAISRLRVKLADSGYTVVFMQNEGCRFTKDE